MWEARGSCAGGTEPGLCCCAAVVVLRALHVPTHRDHRRDRVAQRVLQLPEGAPSNFEASLQLLPGGRRQVREEGRQEVLGGREVVTAVGKVHTDEGEAEAERLVHLSSSTKYSHQ